MLSRSSLLVSVAAAALSAAAPAQAGGIDGLKAEIEALTQKVQELETERSRPPPVPANVVTGGDFEGSYKLPGSNTSLKFGGYVKLDAIYDFDQKGGDQQGGVTVDSATTPVDQDTGHFQMSVRQTRFTFDSRTASEDMGTVRAYLEVDFNDSDSATETVSNSHKPASTPWFRDHGSVALRSVVEHLHRHRLVHRSHRLQRSRRPGLHPPGADTLHPQVRRQRA